jgi:type I restriction enzyme, S subunit
MSGALPDGWVLTTIGDVAVVNPPGSTVSGPDEQLVTFLPMAAMEELTGRIDISDVRSFGAVKKGFTRFREGDLLVAKITPSMENGKVAVARDLTNGKGCGSTEFHVVRPREGVAADYLRYFLVRSAFRQEAKRNMQGAVGQQRVPAHFLRDAALPMPPANQQARIVSKIDELFSRIEEGERALERVQKLVERHRQSVLKAAVTGELTREWREQRKGQLESGEALLKRILQARREAWEQAELGKMKAKGVRPANDKWKLKYEGPVTPNLEILPVLPEGWTWASLSQLSWASNYGTSVKCGYGKTGGVPVLRIPNIRAGRFDFEDIKTAGSDIDLDHRDHLAKGDLLVVRTNGSENIIGVGAVFATEPPFASYFASYLIRFRLVLEDELSEWVNLAWQSHVVRDFVAERRATSAGQYNISQSSLRELCLPVPGTQERREIVDKMLQAFSRSDNSLQSVAAQSRLSSALRQSVLHAAFSGRLVAQTDSTLPAQRGLSRPSDILATSST